MTNGILLTRHNQEIAQWSPDPFPRERVGSGHETNQQAGRDTKLNPIFGLIIAARLHILIGTKSFRHGASCIEKLEVLQ